MDKPILILSEKPSAALKIAEALADKSVTKNVYMKKIPYYELTHNGEKIIVACAVGHLYTVTEKNKKGWTYPIFDIEWKASYEVNKGAAFTKPYLQLIQKLSKESQKIVVACDYDVEGEVIGFNIVRFACGKKDAFRMKFSTTTKEDLREAYAQLMKHIDMGQAEAGITRHELDWLFGINLSRALTLSIKNATGMFKILSSGRVQGPALKLLSAREKEIQAFIPVPYWELELDTEELIAKHEQGKLDDRKKAEEIYVRCNGKKAVVESLEKEQFRQEPPHPFDLTALQLEAYRVFRIQPKETLEIAQVLYINSYISYPRTSSNQLPESIGYKKVLQKLSQQNQYAPLISTLLKQKELKPNNGKKKDDAHPAMYPTGEVPGSLEIKEAKVYDLIVKRFLATFAEAAVRETVSVKIDVNQEKFLANGTRTVEENWHMYYRPYVKLEEAEVHVKERQELHIRELKKRNLGTKATRSEIVESLFDRNYLKRGDSIEVTNLGLKTVAVLEKYCPDILDEQLTKDFEKDMNKIRKGKSTKKEVLAHAEVHLLKVLTQFKANEKEIGKELSGSYQETMKQASFVKKCSCGGDLQIRYTPKFKSYFIACSTYPECKITFSLPRGFLAKNSDKVCSACSFPEILLIKKGKRPWNFCINPSCPKKEEYRKSIAAPNNEQDSPSLQDQPYTSMP